MKTADEAQSFFNRRPKRRRVLISIAGALLISVSCLTVGGSVPFQRVDALPGSASKLPNTEQDSSTPLNTGFPFTPANVSLGSGVGEAYVVDTENFDDQEFLPSDLPIAPGSVEVRWYKGGSTYLAVFIGLSSGPVDTICLATSIESDDEINFISRRPIVRGGCMSIPSIQPGERAAVGRCRGALLFMTEIPIDAKGVLYAHLDQFSPENLTIAGMRTGTPIVPGIPQLDVDRICQ